MYDHKLKTRKFHKAFNGAGGFMKPQNAIVCLFTTGRRKAAGV